MHIFDLIKIVATGMAILVVIWFLINFSAEKLEFISKAKIAFIGFFANLLDTIGIGSFAVIIAMRRMFGVMSDDVRLIGSMNIQAMITALAQALIFLHYIELDLTTLLVSIIMITLGGFLSSLIAVRINKQLVHKIMLYAFIITGILLLLNQLHMLHIVSENRGIHGYKLAVFAVFMLIAGALPAFGVGYYALVNTSIFLFGASPIIAFPIMASASAYQMPVTASIFITKKKFYSISTILLAVFGVLGVFVAAPLISSVNSYTLKWILLVVVMYNIITLAKSSKT